jgi:hypothetical protein
MGTIHLDRVRNRKTQIMTERQFRIAVTFVGLAFTLLFCVVVVPPLIETPDIIGAFGAGFVNPYASGYSSDVIACWLLLAIWVGFEAQTRSVKHGWLCLVVGIVPGVAVGLAAYLLLRSRQVRELGAQDSALTS